jgi:porin
MWVDGQDKARLTNDKNFRDDIGVYTSCDQMLYKENGDAEDTQGLAGFFRYGWASSKYNEMSKFFSAGVQYQGLIHGRDDDVLGLGYAHGTFSNDASATYTEDYESVWEVYYNAQITPWFAIGPSLQYISNPGGVNTAKDAVVVGLRAAITF